MSYDLLPFDQNNDQSLSTRVRLALTLSQRSTLRGIALEVQGGTVTIRGTVPTFYDRQVAFETARHVAGVRHVQDELSVKEPAKTPAPSEPSVLVPTVSVHSPLNVFEESSMQSRSLLSPASSRSSLWGAAVSVLSLLLLVATGCDSSNGDRLKVHPVAGQITLDGSPLPNALVVLHPKDKSNPLSIAARAQTDAQGNFKASTYDQGDGAPAGDYLVTVSFHQATETPDGIVPGPNLLSQQIAVPETTDIVVKVAEGPNQLQPIEVKR